MTKDVSENVGKLYPIHSTGGQREWCGYEEQSNLRWNTLQIRIVWEMHVSGCSLQAVYTLGFGRMHSVLPTGCPASEQEPDR